MEPRKTQLDSASNAMLAVIDGMGVDSNISKEDACAKLTVALAGRRKYPSGALTRAVQQRQLITIDCLFLYLNLEIPIHEQLAALSEAVKFKDDSFYEEKSEELTRQRACLLSLCEYIEDDKEDEEDEDLEWKVLATAAEYGNLWFISYLFRKKFLEFSLVCFEHTLQSGYIKEAINQAIFTYQPKIFEFLLRTYSDLEKKYINLRPGMGDYNYNGQVVPHRNYLDQLTMASSILAGKEKNKLSERQAVILMAKLLPYINIQAHNLRALSDREKAILKFICNTNNEYLLPLFLHLPTPIKFGSFKELEQEIIKFVHAAPHNERAIRQFFRVSAPIVCKNQNGVYALNKHLFLNQPKVKKSNTVPHEVDKTGQKFGMT